MGGSDKVLTLAISIISPMTAFGSNFLNLVGWTSIAPAWSLKFLHSRISSVSLRKYRTALTLFRTSKQSLHYLFFKCKQIYLILCFVKSSWICTSFADTFCCFKISESFSFKEECSSYCFTLFTNSVLSWIVSIT